MVDVFISYAREDRTHAHQLAELLQQRGLSVWWDWNLVGGSDYRDSIRRRLDAADKVIVLWSRHSVGSAFVLDEARLASHAFKLIPVRIDDSEIPLGFGNLHTIDSSDFSADQDLILAALNNAPNPSVKRAARAFKIGGALRWSASLVVASLLAAALVYFAANRGGNSTPTNEVAEALQDYEFIQSVYANVKADSLTCVGARRLVEQIRPYRSNKRPVPPSFAYTVRNPTLVSNPTIGDLALDRMTRIQKVRSNCF